MRNVCILMEFHCQNNKKLYITTAEQDIQLDAVVYKSYGIVCNMSHTYFGSKNNIVFPNDCKDFLPYLNDSVVKVSIFDGSTRESIKTCIVFSTIIHEYFFILELYDALFMTHRGISEVYSKNCRASFCDKKCGLDINQYSITGLVESVCDEVTIYDSNRNEPSTYFANGYISFAQAGNECVNDDCFQLMYQILYYNQGKISVCTLLDTNIIPGWRYKIYRGCNKTLRNCYQYSNCANFRGEPRLEDNL